jgi:hypothetical protein
MRNTAKTGERKRWRTRLVRHGVWSNCNASDSHLLYVLPIAIRHLASLISLPLLFVAGVRYDGVASLKTHATADAPRE